ncbi:lim and transglutaminase domain protein ltd-1-like [Mytilus californianus]|uniref:lim and transglutaminase domain protein ltd-1-like n=1 Tax=Mytilus californianus TaxID=6549 RepID=UPI0022473ACF|nr:lim and transglutaminase domain protein ltd-1-like [Mytilus californianus]
MGHVCSKSEISTTPTEEKQESSRSPSDDNMNTSSDFDGFIFPFEGDSDEVDISAIEDDYPDPKAVKTNEKLHFPDGVKLFDNWDPNTSSDDAINEEAVELLPITQAELDSHAKKTPGSTLNRFEDLITYLEKPALGKESRDDIMVRAILVWLCNQKVETFATEERTKNTPKGFLSLLGQKRSQYSTFFTVLCRQANIKCVQIRGISKTGKYQPEKRNPNDMTCRWNAVYLRNSWHIIHPFWVCGSVYGKQRGGWIRLEKGGKSIGKRQIANPGVATTDVVEYFIMPDPKQFIYRCHPDDSNWQLIPKPISRDKFLDQAYLLPPFWALGLTLLTENSCLLKSAGNAVTITLQGPKATANELNMDYELLLKDEGTNQKDENEMLEPNKIPRLVAKIRNGSEWNFNIQFPVEGIYKIVIYGAPEKRSMHRLCEFQIKCTARTQNCRLTPFNPGLIGFGPGLTSERAGLLLPSHRNGLVTTDKNKPTKLSFLLDSEMSNSMEVRTELFDSDENDQSSLVVTTIEKKELKITTTLVKEGDYGLKILTGTHKSRSDDQITMTVVCNYFVTTSHKFTHEKTNKRLARQNLLSYIENAGFAEIEKIKDGIERCKKEKIPETDFDIENAERKLQVLLFRKDIHDAYMRRHLITTEKTIERLHKSQYERIFTESIRHLEEFASQLNSLEGFTQQLPDILHAVGEFNHTHVTNEQVANTLCALSVLFGDKQKEIETVDDLQAISREAKHKIAIQKDTGSSLKRENAQRALHIIKKYSYEETMKKNAAAAQIHKWVTDVISKLDNKRPDQENV